MVFILSFFNGFENYDFRDTRIYFRFCVKSCCPNFSYLVLPLTVYFCCCCCFYPEHTLFENPFSLMLSVLFLSPTLWLSWDIDVYPSFLQIISYIATTRPNGIKKVGTVITNCMIDELVSVWKIWHWSWVSEFEPTSVVLVLWSHKWTTTLLSMLSVPTSGTLEIHVVIHFIERKLFFALPWISIFFSNRPKYEISCSFYPVLA